MKDPAIVRAWDQLKLSPAADRRLYDAIRRSLAAREAAAAGDLQMSAGSVAAAVPAHAPVPAIPAAPARPEAVSDAVPGLPAAHSRQGRSRRARSRWLKPAALTAAACLLLTAALLPVLDRLRRPAGETVGRPALEVSGQPGVPLPEASNPAVWRPDPDLKPYQLNTEERSIGGDGLGYPIFSYKDISQNESLDLAALGIRPVHLPIYRNLTYAGQKLSAETLLRRLHDLAARYGDTVAERSVVPLYENENRTESNGQQPEAYYGEGRLYLYYADSTGCKVLLKTPVAMPDGLWLYDFGNPAEAEAFETDPEAAYEAQRARVTAAFDWLYERYVHLFGFKQPAVSPATYGYNYFGQRHYGVPAVVDTGGATDTERLVAAVFSRGKFLTEYRPFGLPDTYLAGQPDTGDDRPGAQTNLFYGVAFQWFDLSESLGDYPIMTPAQARTELANGRYFMVIPDPPADLANRVVRCDLIYLTGSFNKDYVPYYRFTVELPPELVARLRTPDGVEPAEDPLPLKHYTFAYVPAIDPAYIAPPGHGDIAMFN